MGITLDKLAFDEANIADGPNVGAVIHDGTDVMAVNGDGSINTVSTVSATDLDIRDLSASQDNVAISDGTDTLAINADGSINITDNGGSITVDGAVTVSSTDLDIRDLSAAQDNVSISDGTDTLAVNADGSINVSFSVDTADDAADSGNPLKVGSRAVDGALTAVSASNDRADMLADMYRRVWINKAPNVAAQTSVATVGLTAVQLAATPMPGRTTMTIQNRGNKSIYIGEANTVTTANGLEIPAGASFDIDYGEDLDVWAISGTASQDVRVFERG